MANGNESDSQEQGLRILARMIANLHMKRLAELAKEAKSDEKTAESSQ